ncbi:similar to Saccharomyces cerevisiae YDR505C PSP1 Asn and gln rich protein of unknown function [Maudiozyma saulgeensis]|uniref:PSP1 C-terminal domain-containing protein n=1 Tax=Maudiozyma saulgeensis TaxID=1789683 RepID=A0A1X7R6R1_9SACH|nr:similar to Saccharomyces cerevisiae YDR505C PSP1 Asn and gln rich protein of unknown function [Kazachstania saulgeensis]
MVIDSILTKPPLIPKTNYVGQSLYKTRSPKHERSIDLSFRFPFITGPPNAGRFREETNGLNFPCGRHVSFKEEDIVNIHRSPNILHNNISPGSYSYWTTEQSATETSKFFSNITPVTTRSTVEIERVKAIDISNSLEENKKKVTKPKKSKEEYINNLDELISSVVNGLLELQNEDKVNGFEENSGITPSKPPFIWDKKITIQSALHGACIFVTKSSNIPLIEQIRMQCLHYFKNYRAPLDRLHDNKEIDFSIWSALNAGFKETTDNIQEQRTSSNTSSNATQDNEAIPFKNDDQSQPNSPLQSTSLVTKMLTQFDIPHLTIKGSYEVPLNGVHSETTPFINFKDGKFRPKEELSQIYKTYGRKYFSTRQVYALVDYIKYTLKPFNQIENNEKFEESTKEENKMTIFVKFLLWYKEMRSRPSSEHYDTRGISSPPDRNLFLCATKNGKLEIFSSTKNSKMLFTRGDIVIVQGDKGKDMAVIVEPILRNNLALLFQFLKKKIQIDASSSTDQIHDNSIFIEDFMNTINNTHDDELIDTSRYGLIDMTRNSYFTKKIIRFSTRTEVTNELHLKYQNELKILHVIRTKIDSYNNSLQNQSSEELQVKILNAEFQFDMSKVYVYYIGDHNADFTGIVSDLFRFYKTRVWFNPVPNNLNVDESYFKGACNELSMLQNMIEVNNLPYIHYNNNTSSFAENDISKISDFNEDELFTNPIRQKWENANSLPDMALDNYQIGMYQELVSQLFD